MSDVMDIRQVRDGDSLKVWLHRGDSSRVVLSFWDGDAGELPFPAFRHAATRGGHDNVMFFADPKNTWGNGNTADGRGLIEEIVEWAAAFRAECGAREVVTLGQGMGGFMAIAMAAFLDVKVALALSPLFAVPARAQVGAGGAGDLRLHNLGEVLGHVTQYYLLHGEGPGEAAHSESFPERANIHQFVLPGSNRDVPRLLDAAGLTAEVLERAFNHQPRRLRRALQDLQAYAPKEGALADDIYARPETAPEIQPETAAGAAFRSAPLTQPAASAKET